jgi:hypothetical protein
MPWGGLAHAAGSSPAQAAIQQSRTIDGQRENFLGVVRLIEEANPNWDDLFPAIANR